MGWAQELTIIMFVWMAKFGAAYGVRTGIHVGVDVLISRLKSKEPQKIHHLRFVGWRFLYLYRPAPWGRPSCSKTVRTTRFSWFGLDTGDMYEGPVHPTSNGRPGSFIPPCRSAPT